MAYSLNEVEEAYSYYATIPFLYNALHRLYFLRKKAISKLNLQQGDIILDIACGTGLNFKHIEKRIGKSLKSKISGKLETSLKFPTKGKIIAIDYTEEMLEQAKKLIKKNNWKNIKLIKADASKIRLKKGFFDGIISTLGFSCIPNHKAALINAIASLKKGKKLVMLEGKLFNFKPLNILMPILRWSKSWDNNKNLIEDIKELFPNKQIKIEQFTLGSNFILELVK